MPTVRPTAREIADDAIGSTPAPSHAPHDDPTRWAGWDGSNVDLPTLDEIDAELRKRSLQIDPAISLFEEASKLHAAAYGEYKESWAKTFLDLKGETKITARKAEAEARNIHLQVRRLQCEIYKELAYERLKARLAQLNAAQTRANVARQQARLDSNL